MRAVRIGHIDGGATILCGAQLDVGTGCDVGGKILLAAEIAGCLFDKRNERSMQGEIVRYVVEGGSENEHASFADLLFEQERRLISQPRNHARLPRIDLDHLVEFNAVELVGAAQRGVFSVSCRDGFKTRTAEGGVAGSLNDFV